MNLFTVFLSIIFSQEVMDSIWNHLIEEHHGNAMYVDFVLGINQDDDY